VGIGLRDLKIISEDAVEADLQRVDPRSPPLFRLQRGNPLPAVPHRCNQTVQLRIIPFPDDPPFANRQRRIIDDRVREQSQQIRHFVDGAVNRLQQRGPAFGDGFAKPGQRPQRCPKRGKVPAVGHSDGDPASQTLQVVNRFQNVPERSPKKMAFPDLGNRGEPLPDPVRITEGMVHPPAKPSPPKGGHRLVKGMKQGPALLSVRNRAEELEISFGGLVQKQMVPASMACDRIDMA